MPTGSQESCGRLHRGGGAGAVSCGAMRGISGEGDTEAGAVGHKKAGHFQNVKGHLFCWRVNFRGWENGRR